MLLLSVNCYGSVFLRKPPIRFWGFGPTTSAGGVVFQPANPPVAVRVVEVEMLESLGNGNPEVCSLLEEIDGSSNVHVRYVWTDPSSALSAGATIGGDSGSSEKNQKLIPATCEGASIVLSKKLKVPSNGFVTLV